VITMMNLQDAKLFRVRDKRLDWAKLKKVIIFEVIVVDLQVDI
jgi:hypothetical protein